MKFKKITLILIVAFLIRLILLIVQYSGTNLPQAGADSVRFERIAFELTRGYDNRSFLEVITNGAHLHAYIGSIIYSVFGREPIIWSLLFIILGLGTIYNIYRSVLLITNNVKIANRSALIACFFPNLGIFSVILLREIYIHFFLSIALFYLLKYLKTKTTSYILFFFIYGLIASIFHTAVISFAFGFVFYIVVFNKKISFFPKIIVVLMAFIGLYYINITGIGLDKFGGSFDNALEVALDGGGGINEEAGSNYSSWLYLKGNILDVFLLPVRCVAFLFAPLFPFFVKNGSHAIGLIDAAIYFLLFYNIYKNRFYHMKSENSKALLIIVLTMTIAFSFGASNFGTNIRHRAKILPIILMIPLINKKERVKKENIISIR